MARATQDPGKTPTFGDELRQVEAHLIGFSEALYDRVLHVELLDWIRDQMRFPGIEQLKMQIARAIDGLELPEPGLMSDSRAVPVGVPSLAHNSVPKELVAV